MPSKGPSVPHAIRRHREAHALTRSDNGIGSRVPDLQMIEFANAWLDQEERKPGQKVSAIATAKSCGLSVTPEWIASTRFQSILEVERFQRRVKRLQAKPELTQLIQDVIDLGLMEAQKRLVLSAGAIPDSVLFGDILHKLPKMVQDFTAGAKPVKAGDIYVTLVKEINTMTDPIAREAVRRNLLDRLDNVALALNSADQQVVDAELPVGDEPVLLIPAPVAEPVPSGVSATSPDLSDDPALWSDPASFGEVVP